MFNRYQGLLLCHANAFFSLRSAVYFVSEWHGRSSMLHTFVLSCCAHVVCLFVVLLCFAVTWWQRYPGSGANRVVQFGSLSPNGRSERCNGLTLLGKSQTFVLVGFLPFFWSLSHCSSGQCWHMHFFAFQSHCVCLPPGGAPFLSFFIFKLIWSPNGSWTQNLLRIISCQRFDQPNYFFSLFSFAGFLEEEQALSKKGASVRLITGSDTGDDKASIK